MNPCCLCLYDLGARRTGTWFSGPTPAPSGNSFIPWPTDYSLELSLSKHKQAQSIHEPSGAPSKFPLRYIPHPTPRILLPSTSLLEHGSEEGKKKDKEMNKAKNDSPMGAAIALPEVWRGTGKIIKIVLLYQPVT